jgi:hypothetical protein
MAVTVAERLREDRDRFVGFAFANADLLLELDGSGRIGWAGGAVKSVLEIDADAILGQPLAKILTDHDATMLMAALRGLGPGERKRGLTFNLQIDGVMPTPRPRAIEACF